MNNNEIVQLVQLICLLGIMTVSFLIGIAIGCKIAQQKKKDKEEKGYIKSMTVGEVIALLCKQASDEDNLLMAKDIYSIEVNDEGINLYFVDANTQDYSIKEKNDE